MSNPTHTLAQQLTGKTSLEECSVEDVERIVQRYPYFAPAQFLLLQKLRQTDAIAEADAQYKKAVLFYHNPLQFDFFISSEKFSLDELTDESTAQTLLYAHATADEQDSPTGLVEISSTNIEEKLLPEAYNDSVAENTDTQLVEEESAGAETMATIEELFPEKENGEEVFEELAEQTGSELGLDEKQLIAAEEAPSQESQSIEFFEDSDWHHTQGEPLTVIEENSLQKNDGIESAEEINAQIEETVVTEQPKLKTNSIDAQEDLNNESVEFRSIETNSVEEENILASRVETITVARQADHSGLTFEPFYTVDYFASQGIKISQEELPKDKLGKQLKSFTEWLKTMKRLPATQASGAAESASDKNVESLAGHSIAGSDVLTEAMAEVWIKQGNTEKALDIYNKLSLHNPSKRAYFAAKIQTLKPF